MSPSRDAVTVTLLSASGCLCLFGNYYVTAATHEILPVCGRNPLLCIYQDMMDASLGNFFDEGTKFMEDGCVSGTRA